MCPVGSVRFGNTCYKVQDQTTDAQYEARDACLSAGGDLVSVATASEQAFLASYLASLGQAGKYWIGHHYLYFHINQHNHHNHKT